MSKYHDDNNSNDDDENAFCPTTAVMLMAGTELMLISSNLTKPLLLYAMYDGETTFVSCIIITHTLVMCLSLHLQ